MGADQGTGAALDTDIRRPDRNLFSNIPLLIPRGADRIGAVIWEPGNRYLIAPAGNDLTDNFLDKLR
ncbi:hypothetical protein ES703_98700 [subsurface metagenome]